jgi:hypothetical protein
MYIEVSSDGGHGIPMPSPVTFREILEIAESKGALV